MLKVLLFSMILAVVLAHDGSSESHETFLEKKFYCPKASSNASADACSMFCPNGTNCTTISCSSDANCTAIHKCCPTNCGMKCIATEHKTRQKRKKKCNKSRTKETMCTDDDDCPGSLTCCEKSCVPVCVTTKPTIPGRKKEKEPKRKTWKKA